MALDKKDRVFKDYSEVKFDFWSSHIKRLELENYAEALIFGCGVWGKALRKEIGRHADIKIVGFCDNNKAVQGSMVENCPVYSAEEGAARYPRALFIIAIDKYSDMIRTQLEDMGIAGSRIQVFDTHNSGETTRKYFSERLNDSFAIDESCPSEAFIPVVKNTSGKDRRDFRVYLEEGLAKTLDKGIDPLAGSIMERYEEAYGEYRSTACISIEGEGKTKVRIMVACSHKDLAGLSEDNPLYYVPIQVGKALTDVCLYGVCDNIGENISDRNYNYCECTALYWAWKNRFEEDADYIGLRHYRRKFDITDEQLSHLKENGIGIVHLDPIYHDNIRNSFVHHTKNEKDWELMAAVIKGKFPEYYPDMEAYEKQHFICAYNMSIMRRDIFDEYCCFLFGVLTEIEACYLKVCDRRDRYLGYLAENLTSIFLMNRKGKCKQVIAKLIPMIKQ